MKKARIAPGLFREYPEPQATFSTASGANDS